MNQAMFEMLITRLQNDRTTNTLDRLGALVASKPPPGVDLTPDPRAQEFFARGLKNLGTRIFVRANQLGWSNGLKPKQLFSRVERMARAGQLNENTINWIVTPPVAAAPPHPMSRPARAHA